MVMAADNGTAPLSVAARISALEKQMRDSTATCTLPRVPTAILKRANASVSNRKTLVSVSSSKLKPVTSNATPIREGPIPQDVTNKMGHEINSRESANRVPPKTNSKFVQKALQKRLTRTRSNPPPSAKTTTPLPSCHPRQQQQPPPTPSTTSCNTMQSLIDITIVSGEEDVETTFLSSSLFDFNEMLHTFLSVDESSELSSNRDYTIDDISPVASRHMKRITGRFSNRHSLSYQCGDLEDAILSVIEPLENLKKIGPEDVKAAVRDFKAGAATLETMMKKMFYILSMMLAELLKDDNGGRGRSEVGDRRDDDFYGWKSSSSKTDHYGKSNKRMMVGKSNKRMMV